MSQCFQGSFLVDFLFVQEPPWQRQEGTGAGGSTDSGRTILLLACAMNTLVPRNAENYVIRALPCLFAPALASLHCITLCKLEYTVQCTFVYQNYAVCALLENNLHVEGAPLVSR